MLQHRVVLLLHILAEPFNLRFYTTNLIDESLLLCHIFPVVVEQRHDGWGYVVLEGLA